MEAILEGEGITNEPETKRKNERLARSIERGANFVATFVQHFTVSNVKFIRWLRNFVYRKAPWEEARARLTKVYAKK